MTKLDKINEKIEAGEELEAEDIRFLLKKVQDLQDHATLLKSIIKGLQQEVDLLRGPVGVSPSKPEQPSRNERDIKEYIKLSHRTEEL